MIGRETEAQSVSSTLIEDRAGLRSGELTGTPLQPSDIPGLPLQWSRPSTRAGGQSTLHLGGQGGRLAQACNLRVSRLPHFSPILPRKEQLRTAGPWAKDANLAGTPALAPERLCCRASQPQEGPGRFETDTGLARTTQCRDDRVPPQQLAPKAAWASPADRGPRRAHDLCKVNVGSGHTLNSTGWGIT